MSAELRILQALQIARHYGANDGAHHKQWVIDQMVRALAGSEPAYRLWVSSYTRGEDGPDTYAWDEGIAP